MRIADRILAAGTAFGSRNDNLLAALFLLVRVFVVPFLFGQHSFDTGGLAADHELRLAFSTAAVVVIAFGIGNADVGHRGDGSCDRDRGEQ